MNFRVTKIENASPADEPRMTRDEAEPYVPMHRATYPNLLVLDDGSDNAGELLRIRRGTFEIGRNEGDINFPAERLMSAQHCKIELREIEPNAWCWLLSDLDSRHGLFLRLDSFVAKPGMQFLCGGSKFSVGGPSSSLTTADLKLGYSPFVDKSSDSCELTIDCYSVAQESLAVKLKQSLVIGSGVRENGCSVKDPFVDYEHATMELISENKWQVTDRESLNGLWLRVKSVQLDDSHMFLAGEQRFVFQPGLGN